MSNESQQPIEHLDQLAFLLFADRQQAELDGDGNCPIAFEPGRNPEAQQLYMLGLRDLINCMQAWREQNVEPDAVASMLESIYHATSIAVTAH